MIALAVKANAGTVRLRQAWQSARAGLGLDADRRVRPELAERVADDGCAGSVLEQREDADSGQPVAAAVVQAEQHAIGAEARDEPRGRGLDGGCPCSSQRMGSP